MSGGTVHDLIRIDSINLCYNYFKGVVLDWVIKIGIPLKKV